VAAGTSPDPRGAGAQAGDETGVGLAAAVAMARSALGAELAVAFLVRGWEAGAPVAHPIEPALPPFPLDDSALSLLDAARPLPAGGVGLPTGLVMALAGRPSAVAALACREGGVPVGGILALWAEGAAVPAAVPGAVLELLPFLSRLLREREALAEGLRVRRRFEDLLASVPLGLIFVDARSEEALVNEAAARLLGCGVGVAPPEQVAGAMRALRARCALPAADAASVATLARPDGRLSETWDLDGRVYAVESHPVLGRSRNGRVWLIEDVTVARQSRRRLEELADALRAARDEAEAASRAKSRFLAMMSHEVRTPLAGVTAAIDLLADLLADADRGESARGLLGSMRASADALLAVLDDTLDFSKIEAGHLVLERVPLDPSRVAGDVVEAFRAAAAMKGLGLDLRADGAPARVLGDPTRLRQVLANLVGNAVKFTQAGRIDLAVAADGRGLLAFEVSDTGVGLGDGDPARLFEAFSQGDETTTRRFGGTGLGLAICRRLVEAMGGEISASPRPGGGSTFRFSVPAPDAPPLEAPAADVPPTEAPPAPAAPLRVLLAEDNELNRGLVKAILERLGHRVVAVADGRAAVRAAAAAEFDVALMDMHMPVLDGPGATREIRALPGPRGALRVLALSADATPQGRAQAERLGMDGYLTKPVDRATLAAVLSRLPPAPAPGPALGPGRDAIDRAHVADLVEGLGHGGVASLAALWPAEAERSLGAMRAALGRGDAAALAASAHTAKGMASNLGMSAVADLADRLQAASAEEAPALLDALRAAGAEAGAALDALLAELAAQDGAAQDGAPLMHRRNDGSSTE
jgi:signal transduction histidine kinase/CheY-like chemotaxis protein